MALYAIVAIVDADVPTCDRCGLWYPTKRDQVILKCQTEDWYEREVPRMFLAAVDGLKAKFHLNELEMCHVLWMSRREMARYRAGGVPKLLHVRFAEMLLEGDESLSRETIKRVLGGMSDDAERNV